NWDQRFMCSVTKVKTVYSRLNQQLKKQTETAMTAQTAANDAVPNPNPVPPQVPTGPHVDPPPPADNEFDTAEIKNEKDDHEEDDHEEDDNVSNMLANLQIAEFSADIMDITV
ncbi:MAG: hypothetical protein VXY99_00835, partial [Pseudomonadota bacterium]|nr:hypothetical protein [Pseudomonadota bacterium]